MTPVIDFPAETQRFVENGLWGGRRKFGAATAIGFASAECGLVAGVVYHNFEPDSSLIELSAYSQNPRWLTRRHMTLILSYPFDQLECRAVVARHSERNLIARRLWGRLGAQQTLVPELRGDGEAEVIALLRKTDWQQSKFNEVNHGQA